MKRIKRNKFQKKNLLINCAIVLLGTAVIMVVGYIYVYEDLKNDIVILHQLKNNCI